MTSRTDTVDPTDVEMVDIADADEFWDGEMDAFDVGDREVLVIKIDGSFHAFDGICPHQSISLVEGALDGEVLTCRAHEWQFNAVSGLGINPSNECLVRHACEVREGVVYVSTEPIGRSADLIGSTVEINKPNEKG
jgi:toluene monooxygenase system ferredoxin subunit